MWESINRGDVCTLRCERVDERGMSVVVGRDMNEHIWEMDSGENKNRKLIKQLACECSLEVGNCVIDGLVCATWCRGTN